MQALAPVLIFLSLYTLAAGFRARSQSVKVDLHGRLKNVLETTDYEEVADLREAELNRPLAERLLRPFLGILSALASKLLPAQILQSLEKKVQLTGKQRGLSAKDYLGMKLLLAVGLPVFIYIINQGVISSKTTLMMVMGVVIGWRFPNMKLDQSIRQRHEIMEKTFPDVLDMLTVSVEAGLGFDGAMAKVVEKSSGPIPEEFRRILKEIKMGKSRREALRDFGERCGVDDIRMFASTIIQADQLGLNIGNTLKNQAEQMRRKRRQRVEEKAMKVPVKMLIPMIVFIFPTIFIVLLGPALIQIIENFSM